MFQMAIRTGSLAVTVALAVVGAGTVHAQETVQALQVVKTRVTQVVVGSESGQNYVMSTLQPLETDKVLVTPAMAAAAKPFSVMGDVFTPVSSLDELPSKAATQAVALKMTPGFKEVHSHSFNDVYEVIYRDGDRWMSVETTQAPEKGSLVLTDALKRKAKLL